MAKTLVVNFGHPLADDAQAQLAEAVGEYEVRKVPVQLDMPAPLAPQVAAIVDRADLSPEEWQTRSIVVVLPGMAIAAGLLLAELHGRCGYFPRVLKLVSGEDRVFRLGEIIDLSQVRNAARQARK